MTWFISSRLCVMLVSVVVAFSTPACGGSGGGCLSIGGCAESCSPPTATQTFQGNFAAAPTAIVNPDAPVLEAQVRAGAQVSLLLIPVAASNVCLPEATWVSTNPSAAGFQSGNPDAGTYTAPHGDAVFHAIAPGDTTVYVLVRGARYELFYVTLQKRIALIHVLP